VQEALTNVRKHAPGARATVTLDWSADALRVEIRDTGTAGAAPRTNGSAPPGHGLAGMRERARIHGGALRAGPEPGGGFAVVATLPLGDA
jgi:signal transduction histidine kinase